MKNLKKDFRDLMTKFRFGLADVEAGQRVIFEVYPTDFQEIFDLFVRLQLQADRKTERGGFIGNFRFFITYDCRTIIFRDKRYKGRIYFRSMRPKREEV